MTNKGFADKLVKIGYSTLWLDYGVLTIDYLIEQEQTFDYSSDQNSEHYRYHTFSDYLSSKNNLSNIEFDNYLKLTFADSDSAMAGSAAVDLFKKVDLTEQQFRTLCQKIGHFGEWTEKIVTREILLRKLRTGQITDDLLKECIATGDSIIHQYILDIADSNQLQVLAINGITKKIRNIANEKLNRLTGQQKSR